LDIEASRVTDFQALGREWRDLEARIKDVPFFRRWTWVGCLAEERFPDPVLLRAVEAGRTVGLTLFNRHRHRLVLGETGEPDLDAPFVEHNGPLILPRPGLEASLLRFASALPGTRGLRLSGVATATREAMPGVAVRSQTRIAPYVDLAVIRASGADYLSALSSNTRYQVRRSLRRAAPVEMDRAGGVDEAQTWLAALIDLHETSWRQRGKLGAFSTPWLRRFHAELVIRAQEAGELDLLRLRGGGRVLGYLYNFRSGPWSFAYQSGLETRDLGPHDKPGLMCHVRAIERALAAGDAGYDFLGGDHRYKFNLANAERLLHWIDVVPVWSPMGLAIQLGRRLRLLRP
jgi:CelD/BcsL family acetyltransferase involved in cellulose biosynthesis